jgi:hypothetical protein
MDMHPWFVISSSGVIALVSYVQYDASCPITTYSRMFSDPTKAHFRSQTTLREPESQYSLNQIPYNIQFHVFCKW